MPCTTILVGKNASYDGSTMMARTEDSPSGEFTPKRFTVVRPEDQPDQSDRARADPAVHAGILPRSRMDQLRIQCLQCLCAVLCQHQPDAGLHVLYPERSVNGELLLGEPDDRRHGRSLF